MLVRKAIQVRAALWAPSLVASATALAVFLVGAASTFAVRGDGELFLAAALATFVAPVLVWAPARFALSGVWDAEGIVERAVRDLDPGVLTVAEAKAVLSLTSPLHLGLYSVADRIEKDAGTWLRRGRAPRGVVRSVRSVRFLYELAPAELIFFADRIERHIGSRGWHRSAISAFGSSERTLSSLVSAHAVLDDPMADFFSDLVSACGFGTSLREDSHELYEEGFDLALRAFDMGPDRADLLWRILHKDCVRAVDRDRERLERMAALVDLVESLPDPAVRSAAALVVSWEGSVELLCEVTSVI